MITENKELDTEVKRLYLVEAKLNKELRLQIERFN